MMQHSVGIDEAEGTESADALGAHPIHRDERPICCRPVFEGLA